MTHRGSGRRWWTRRERVLLSSGTDPNVGIPLVDDPGGGMQQVQLPLSAGYLVQHIRSSPIVTTVTQEYA